MQQNWDISGTYFEACNCEAACPCIMLGDPTDGDCQLLVAWHIDQGNFQGVSLNGLNTAMAVYTPENMMKGQWKAALYIDQNASDAQKEALTKIFGGQAGGVIGAVAPLIGEVWGVTPAQIEYQANGKKRHMRINNVAHVDVEAIQGQNGMDVLIENPPLTLVPGTPAVVARSKQASYTDHGQQWSFSGKNSFYSPFHYQAG